MLEERISCRGDIIEARLYPGMAKNKFRLN